MNPNENDDVDALLRDWAEKHAAPANKLDNLAYAIRSSLSDENLATIVSHRKVTRRDLAWLAIGGALAASVALILYFGAFRSSHQPSVADSSPQAARIAQSELDQKIALARELQGLFPGRFAWATECDHDMRIGLTSADVDRPSPNVIVVRFTVESRAHGDGKWQTLRTVDILTLAEEVVEAAATTKNDLSVVVWTYATPDGLISIDANLDLAGPVPIRISSSRLQPAGTPTEVWQSEQGGVEYRVYQAAELLDRKRVG